MDDIDFAPGTSRPNGAFMALLEALIREIALALSLPYGFVYNMASFAMDPLDAQTLFPEPAKVDALGGNDEPAPVAKPAAKKPKPDTVK